MGIVRGVGGIRLCFRDLRKMSIYLTLPAESFSFLYALVLYFIFFLYLPSVSKKVCPAFVFILSQFSRRVLFDLFDAAAFPRFSF